MDINFIPYDFKEGLATFKRQLLLIGITYYDRLLVFVHLNRPIDHVLHFPISSIELAFNKKEQMVAVWLFLEKCNKEDLLATLESNFGKPGEKVVYDDNFKIDNKLVYIWKFKSQFLGMGSKEQGRTLFIYYTPRKQTLYYTNNQ